MHSERLLSGGKRMIKPGMIVSLRNGEVIKILPD
jgi:hypothetical protein